jgi:GNAT superfamily N-acetyltransferase
MEPVRLNDDQFAQYLALANHEIGPLDASASLQEDFPLILGEQNRDWVEGLVVDDQVVAGLACLIRQFKTSCGTIPVAGIGHVVTRPGFRGRGFSRLLQDSLLARLRGANVPLAVLWTETPEVFAGRGFTAAGYEFHVGLEGMTDVTCPPGFTIRPYTSGDCETVERLYRRHPYRTLRHPGDSNQLYGMAGTRGLVAAGEGDIPAAAVFCGKGADFPDFATEWSGPVGLVLPLISAARNRGWLRFVLVPAGQEKMAETLVATGCQAGVVPSGHWAVLQPDQLSNYLQGAGHGAPAEVEDPRAVLGFVDDGGVVVPGALTVAVWGFDSV